MDIGSDLGLALSSLRLRLDSLESTVGGRDISLSARAPPARDSAFHMVRRRQTGDFRRTNILKLFRDEEDSTKIDSVKFFEFMLVNALPESRFKRHLKTGTHSISFLKVWKGLCFMGTAGRLWVTKRIFSFFITKQRLDDAYENYKTGNIVEAERDMRCVITAFIVCIMIYKIYGRNLDVVKAALTVEVPEESRAPLIASSYGYPEILDDTMLRILDLCMQYETERRGRVLLEYDEVFRTLFRRAMNIPVSINVYAWAAGVLRAPT